MSKQRDVSKLTAAQSAEIRERIRKLVESGVPMSVAFDAAMGRGAHAKLWKDVEAVFKMADRF